MKTVQMSLIDNKIEVGKFEYQIKYSKVGAPTTSRNVTFSTIDIETYDSIIFEVVLNRLCNIVYATDYFYEFIGNVIFIEIVKANNFIGEFQFTFLDLNTGKKKCVYSVEIEPMFEVNSREYNLAELDEPYATYPPKKKKKVKEKKKEIAEWVKQEKKRVIKEFILLLYVLGALDKLKQHYSRTSFYRHLKYCEEKGYIKDGILIREVYKSK